MENIITMELIIMLIPILLIQMGLVIFCLVKILKEGVANLNKPLWILIVLLINLIGPIVFLIVGRRKDVK
jgi:hypothetical protein